MIAANKNIYYTFYSHYIYTLDYTQHKFWTVKLSIFFLIFSSLCANFFFNC